jgi:hypothetical protein
MPFSPKFCQPMVKAFSGDLDPLQFIEVFSTAVRTGGGGGTTEMCNLFPLALSGMAQSWFYNQLSNSINSWARLHELFIANFQGNFSKPLTSDKLYTIKQVHGESLRSYFNRFSKVKSQIADAPTTSVIDAFILGLLPGEVNRAVTRMRPKTTEELYDIVEDYARGEDGDINKLKASRKSEQVSTGGRARDHSRKGPQEARHPYKKEVNLLASGNGMPSRGSLHNIAGNKNKKGQTNRENGKWCEYHKRSGHDLTEYHTYAAKTAKIMERGPVSQQPNLHHSQEIQPFKTITPEPVLLLSGKEHATKEMDLPFQRPTLHIAVILGGSASG